MTTFQVHIKDKVYEVEANTYAESKSLVIFYAEKDAKQVASFPIKDVVTILTGDAKEAPGSS